MRTIPSPRRKDELCARGLKWLVRRISKLTLILLSSALLSSTVVATTLVGLRKKDAFVIGADSKVTYSKGIKGPDTACKIYQSGRIYFAIAGFANDRNTNFLPDKIVASSFSSSGSFESDMRRMEHAVSDSVLTEMKRAKAEYREEFDRIQRERGDVFTVLVAEMVRGHPIMAGRGFNYIDGTSPNILIHHLTCPGDCPSGEEVFFAGHQQSARKRATEFYKNHTTVTRPTDFVVRLVDAEIEASPEEVGPPITVVHVDKWGAHWTGNDSGCPILLAPVR